MISDLKLENDKEIMVMKSIGLSPLKLSNPSFFVALLASLILFTISHFILPKTYKNFKILQNEIRNSSQNFILKDNIFIDINKNQTIFISRLRESNKLEEIFVQDRSDPSLMVEFFSNSGSLILDKKIILSMKDGTRVSTDPKGKSTILNFRSYDIEINRDSLKSDATHRVIEYNEYSFIELINKSKNVEKSKGKLLAEAHSRNTIILMPFVFSCIVMLTILKTGFSRIFSFYRKTSVIGLIFIVQSLVLIIKNLVHSNIILLPLMYLFPLIIIIMCILLLNKNNRSHKLQSFYKEAL